MTNKTSPVQIKAGTKFTKVSVSGNYSLIVDENGNLYGMGDAYYLGIESLLTLTPKKVN